MCLEWCDRTHLISWWAWRLTKLQLIIQTCNRAADSKEPHTWCPLTSSGRHCESGKNCFVEVFVDLNKEELLCPTTSSTKWKCKPFSLYSSRLLSQALVKGALLGRPFNEWSTCCQVSAWSFANLCQSAETSLPRKKERKQVNPKSERIANLLKEPCTILHILSTAYNTWWGVRTFKSSGQWCMLLHLEAENSQHHQQTTNPSKKASF